VTSQRGLPERQPGQTYFQLLADAHNYIQAVRRLPLCIGEIAKYFLQAESGMARGSVLLTG